MIGGSIAAATLRRSDCCRVSHSLSVYPENDIIDQVSRRLLRWLTTGKKKASGEALAIDMGIPISLVIIKALYTVP